MVHGDKMLEEKLGRNDLCPCGSGRRFQEVLHAKRPVLTESNAITSRETDPCPRNSSSQSPVSYTARCRCKSCRGYQLRHGSAARSRASNCFARRRMGVRISPDPPWGCRLAAGSLAFNEADVGSNPTGPTKAPSISCARAVIQRKAASLQREDPGSSPGGSGQDFCVELREQRGLISHANRDRHPATRPRPVRLARSRASVSRTEYRGSNPRQATTKSRPG